MIRRYSFPRHFTAGCTNPRFPRAINSSGFTTIPSPPRAGADVHPPAGKGGWQHGGGGGGGRGRDETRRAGRRSMRREARGMISVGSLRYAAEPTDRRATGLVALRRRVCGRLPVEDGDDVADDP